MHAEAFDMGAELLHWRRTYPQGPHFRSDLPFERYVATLKFGYDNFLRHYRQDLSQLTPSLHEQYHKRVATSERIHWAEAEAIVIAVWERMHGDALLQRQSSTEGAHAHAVSSDTLRNDDMERSEAVQEGIPYLDDEQWERISEVLVGGREPRIRGNRNQRYFIDAVLWVAHHRQCWSKLPAAYGNSHNIYVHFNRWMKLGMWEPIGDILHYTPHARAFADLMRKRYGNPNAPMAPEAMQ